MTEWLAYMFICDVEMSLVTLSSNLGNGFYYIPYIHITNEFINFFVIINIFIYVTNEFINFCRNNKNSIIKNGYMK